MGQKERAKRAKLAAAESDAPPSKAVAKRPAGPGSGSRTTSASSGSGAGGGPASSANSGRVDAEGCATIEEYTEGVGGKYTCAECGARPYRSRFLIEAKDPEGKLCVERDWEGRLYGRCYKCCRGRGPQCGWDIYADLVPATDEETLMKKFECNKKAH